MRIYKKIKSILILTGTLFGCIGLGYILYKTFKNTELIPSVFILGAFLTAAKTDFWVYGVVFSLLSVAAVNFAFTLPYLAFDFTVSENIISAAMLLLISVLTSGLTTKLKKHNEIKTESEKERMRGNLLRAISHDLRTPLTTIYGSSSAILENYEEFSDDNIKKMLTGIKEDALWLNRMVENLLSVTKIENSNVSINKTDTVIDELVDSILVKFRKRYPDTKVDVEVPGEFVTVPMDAILIQQVVINMLENAVDHAKGMTKIDFKIRLESKKVVFEVHDDGCGIPNKIIKDLFSGNYISGNDVADKNKNNAGIGLTVCNSIIKAHGGEIKAENKKTGGAVFSFELSAEGVQYE